MEPRFNSKECQETCVKTCSIVCDLQCMLERHCKLFFVPERILQQDAPIPDSAACSVAASWCLLFATGCACKHLGRVTTGAMWLAGTGKVHASFVPSKGNAEWFVFHKFVHEQCHKPELSRFCFDKFEYSVQSGYSNARLTPRWCLCRSELEKLRVGRWRWRIAQWITGMQGL